LPLFELLLPSRKKKMQLERYNNQQSCFLKEFIFFLFSLFFFPNENCRFKTVHTCCLCYLSWASLSHKCLRERIPLYGHDVIIMMIIMIIHRDSRCETAGWLGWRTAIHIWHGLLLPAIRTYIQFKNICSVSYI
jgi:hypothetical protein